MSGALRDIRLRAGWTQAQAAWAAGVAVGTCRLYEIGAADEIRDELREKLAALFGYLRKLAVRRQRRRRKRSRRARRRS
jgi:DNA-binding XRE family transcriptional regulator